MDAVIKTTTSDKVNPQNATKKRIRHGGINVTPTRKNPLMRVMKHIVSKKQKPDVVAVAAAASAAASAASAAPDALALALQEVINARAKLARSNELMLENGLSGNLYSQLVNVHNRLSSVIKKGDTQENIHERTKVKKIIELIRNKKAYTNKLELAIETAKQEARKAFGDNYKSSDLYKNKLDNLKLDNLSNIAKLDKTIAEATSFLAHITASEVKEDAKEKAKAAKETAEINAEIEEIKEIIVAEDKAAKKKAEKEGLKQYSAAETKRGDELTNQAKYEATSAAKKKALEEGLKQYSAAETKRGDELTNQAKDESFVAEKKKTDKIVAAAAVAILAAATEAKAAAEAKAAVAAAVKPVVAPQPVEPLKVAGKLGSRVPTGIPVDNNKIGDPLIPSGIIDDNTTIEASIANTNQALLKSIDLCIAVQKSTVEDKNVIDNKIIVAINDTINSENYNFSKNTLKKAIEAISSITKDYVTYSRVESSYGKDTVRYRYIKERKSAVEPAGAEAIKVLGEHENLQTLVTSIVAILPYYVIDKKNAFSIIAIFTILAAKDCVKFASSTSLTIPALNSFMAALNAFEASLELEAINEKLKKQTGGTGDDAFMTGGDKFKIAMSAAASAIKAAPGAAAGMGKAAAGVGKAAVGMGSRVKASGEAMGAAASAIKAAPAAAARGAARVASSGMGMMRGKKADAGVAADVAADAGEEKEALRLYQDQEEKTTDVVEEDDKAPPSITDRIALQIAQVKASNNLALKAEHYFYTCVALQEEAERSGSSELKMKANSARFFAQGYYLKAKTSAEEVTATTLNTGSVSAEALGILTKENIDNQKEKREAIDNVVKKIMNATTSVEEKITQLMEQLNLLLDNKRELYDAPNIQADVTNAKAIEEQAHIASINKIMNYLNEKNIDLKYYWAEIVTSKYDKEKLRGKVGIINEITETTKTENTENADVKGLWNVKLWIPDTKGEYISSPHGAVSKNMKVITKDNKTIDTFIQQNSVSIYSVRFLKDIKYDPYLSNNRQPDVTNANTRTLGRLTSANRRYRSRVNAITNVSGLTRDIIDNAADFGSRVNKKTLGIGEFKSKYKNEIAKILDYEISDEAEQNLLKTVIVYKNKKLSIRDILASNISSIFAKGETSLNVFRQQNLKKNFEKKKPDPDDEEEGAAGADDGEPEEEDDEEEEGDAKTVKDNPVKGNPVLNTVTGIKVGGGQEDQEEDQEEEEQTGGLGGYGFRNFDKDDAENFIDFILKSLLELQKINGTADSKLSNNQALLFEKYLRSLFGKVGPITLNTLLPQIDNTIEVSVLVIQHFINRLNQENEGKQKNKEGEGKGDDKGDDKGEEKKDDTPAKKISQLNFSLKHNAESVADAIIDITLNTQELKGSEADIENYLDRKYDAAMKKPRDEEMGRIANSQLRDVFKSIFGESMSTINIYRENIRKMDELIDTINEKNINKKFKEINGLLVFAKIDKGKGVITYKMPNKIMTNLEALPADDDNDAKLARALALIAQLKDATDIEAIKAKAREQQFI